MSLNYTLQNARRALIALAVGGAMGVRTDAVGAVTERESNLWPFTVETTFAAPEGKVNQYGLGPLFFSEPEGKNGPARAGFRPLWVETSSLQTGTRNLYSLYPLFRYTEDADGERWSLLSLVRREVSRAKSDQVTKPNAFEVWPFYLRRADGPGGDNYTAFFPIRGALTNRFGRDRWDFTLFPLYSRTEKSGRVITQTPWPIVRRIEGAGHHGWELWPLAGQRERAGEYRRSFFLWPLGYAQSRDTERGVPEIAGGFLPFYAHSSGPDHRSETFIWPFFGYTHRSGPIAYRQTDYFWPLFVQGRGEARTLNRWAPFYSHSTGRGKEKTWYLWPLFRHETLRFADRVETDRRFLFVVFRETAQRRANDPHGAAATRTHLWPLFSAWDNGAGQRQVQFLSPLEPLFPNQEAIRVSYSPLFALYRYHQTEPRHERHSLLWNFLTVTRAPARTEWHVGPLLDGATGDSAHVSLLRGLVGLKRESGTWRPFVFNFSRQASAAATP